MEKPITDKLYLTDSYAVSFEAALISCVSRKNGNYDVVMDASAFYPESGGQLADTGTLGGARVISVRETDGGAVIHETDVPLKGRSAAGKIDWNIRFDHMQQHSGQHVLSRSFIEICGAETVSFHMGDDGCTIDLATGECSEEILAAAEHLANSIIQENRNIIVTDKTPEEVDTESIRKALPAGAAVVRLVEVEGFDVCPCCGTHVRRTGELGAIKILKSEKVKGQVRIHFKSGMRALRDYAWKHSVASQLSNRFTTSIESVVEKVDKLATENRDLRKSLQQMSKKIMAVDRERLCANAVESSGQRHVVELLRGADPDYLKALSSSFKSEKGYLVLLASDCGMVVSNASPDLSIDLAAILVESARQAGGNGGGSGAFASVKLPASVNIEQFLREVYSNVKNRG
jgi:alanyl-tRNA synthetase